MLMKRFVFLLCMMPMALGHRLMLRRNWLACGSRYRLLNKSSTP